MPAPTVVVTGWEQVEVPAEADLQTADGVWQTVRVPLAAPQRLLSDAVLITIVEVDAVDAQKPVPVV